jgi:hypothetical protein
MFRKITDKNSENKFGNIQEINFQKVTEYFLENNLEKDLKIDLSLRILFNSIDIKTPGPACERRWTVE